MWFPTNILGSLVLSASLALAFKGTTPLLLFSSLPPPLRTEVDFSEVSHIQLHAQTLGTTKQILSNTSPDLVVLISQPSNAQELLSEIPELRRAYQSSNVKTRMQVREVIGMGAEQVEDIVSFTRSKMGPEVHVEEGGVWVFLGKDKAGQNAKISLGELGLEHWVSESAKYQQLDLDALSASNAAYTIVYIETPAASSREDLDYELESEFHATEHIDLKRDLRARVPKGTKTDDDRPLFEKYQFFTPGIFMGLIAVLIMLSIGSVGLNAVSSLQVSYGAFDKENGPAAQRKQQQ